MLPVENGKTRFVWTWNLVGGKAGQQDEGVAWFGKEVARNKMKFVAQFGREVAVWWYKITTNIIIEYSVL